MACGHSSQTVTSEAVKARARGTLTTMPARDVERARNAIQQAAGSRNVPVSGTGTAAPAQGLAQSLSDVEADLDAMTLRLLVTALDADRAAQREASTPAAQPAGGAGTGHDEGVPGDDPAADGRNPRPPPRRPSVGCPGQGDTDRNARGQPARLGPD